jgi:putative membrane-bound dehydrogenase-like protein
MLGSCPQRFDRLWASASTGILAAGRVRGRTSAPVLALAGVWTVLLGGADWTSGAGDLAESAGVPFRVPPGFVAERVAAPPLVRHPMFACFDERGRLLIADSAGVNPRGEDLREHPPHRIRRLEDTDGDGRFDAGADFAVGLTYPQGVLWHDGAVFTASPPSLWRLEDTDGDGCADRRDELVTGWVLTGVADELHGPSLGPDGRVYWFCGRFPHTIRRPGERVLRRGRSPLILRCRPDGRDVEILSGAQGNPVKAAFTPEGEPLVCGTWSGRDGDRQDVIIHCVEGGDYPVLDGDFHEHKRTGDLLPPLCQLGVAAASGVLRYRGDAFPADYRGNLLSALFNMHKVLRHVVERNGATFRSREVDFLVSDDADFHPTDVVEDADGSVLVVDTGSWFSHCPTSKVGATRVEGGIYRVRFREAAPVADPRGLELDWSRLDPRALARLLDDPRFTVRDRAVDHLARQGAGAVEVLRGVLAAEPSARGRRNAVWALSRIETATARAAIRAALDDADPGVRLTAATAVDLGRDAEAAPRLIEAVRTDSAPVRREAATALGRMRRAEAVPALLDQLQPGIDRFLEHALIFALIRIADREATLAGLRHSSAVVRRGALIALDQMEGGGLALESVAPLLESSDAALQQAALKVLAARSEWAGGVIDLFRRWLAREDLDEARRASLRDALAAYSRVETVQDLVAATLRRAATPVATRLLVLEAVARSPLHPLPRVWVEAVRGGLDDPDPRVVRQAVAILRASRASDCDAALLGLARDSTRPAEARVDALAAILPRRTCLEPAEFAFLAACLRADRPPLLRLAAAGVLGQGPLDEGQLDALADAVAAAGSLELSRLLPAFERTPSATIGARLVDALGRSPGVASLTPQTVETLLRPFPGEVKRQAAPLLERLESDVRRQAARLAALEPLLAQGDVSRGREVFLGQKAACTTCHAITGKGGRVGPDLGRIGAIRTGRDLLEAIVLPSASFARGFEPYVIATGDGRVHSGIITRESSDAIELVAADRTRLFLPRDTIESIARVDVSIMPQGMDAQLTRGELADLVAYLRSLK